jgi:hypothetical protein
MARSGYEIAGGYSRIIADKNGSRCDESAGRFPSLSYNQCKVFLGKRVFEPDRLLAIGRQDSVS